MRLILDAEIRPETVDRVRALSTTLEVIDVTADPSFDAKTLADPDVEVIIGSRSPADLAGVPSLRWLQVRSAGVDHMAADPPWRHGITVTNAKGVYAVPIGEYVTGMVLRVHQPVGVWSADQAAHRWPPDGAAPALISIVRGKTAVIAGYGSIGREVARQLSALGLRIIAVKPRPDVRIDTSFRVPGTGDPDGSIPERIVGDEELATVAAEADILVVTMPLTDSTRGIVSREVIAALPPGAWLVNVARGPLVDEPALLEALRAGRLAGAILDVFGEEPLPGDSPWWDAPNVIVTPHASGHTLRFFDELVVENVRRYLAGETLLNLVDPGRGY
ncbi:MAG: D-2-hydroxyacid dehydrogenase [Chloroflexota bacterium]